MKKEMTCIVCPIGCRMTVEREDNGEIRVEGNTCPRGKKYAVSELTNPVRTLTSTVRIIGGTEAFLPVKTAQPIAKSALFESMDMLRKLSVNAPVKAGDVITEVAGSPVVAGKDISAAER